MKLAIEVTQLDIDQGKRSAHCECPISLAARRALGVAKDQKISVTRQNLMVIMKGDLAYKHKRIPYTLPCEAISFILKYDAGKSVAPFTFEIDL